MSGKNVEYFQSGEVFHGYRIERLLGSGGAGAVYLARHEMLDTLYAIKVLSPAVVVDDAVYVKRFLREARLASRIRHPNLVAVHDCGHDSEKNLYYLVMDYVPGGSLRDAIAFEGKIPLERSAEIVAQVASALDAAQAFQVVHRDIKPENIMLQPDGLVKLVDLGIAKAKSVGDSLKTNTDSTFGTPSYMSPEQAQCTADVDTRADIYSLGVVFYEMLTGKCPLKAKSTAQLLLELMSGDSVPDVRDVDPDIRPEIAILIRRMMVRDRDRRISSFKTVLSELNKLGLGNCVHGETRVEYPQASSTGMKTLLSKLDSAPSSSADPLAAPDDDVREFMSRRIETLRRKSYRRRLLLWIAAAVSVAIAAIVILFSR